MKLRKYTEADLRNAVAGSTSFRGVSRKLGIAEAGGSYATMYKAVTYFKCDTSHFTGKSWLKDKTYSYRRRDLKEILVYEKFENSHTLKSRLIVEGVKTAKCERCLLSQWLDDTIPLELHHIDGDRKNHLLENLRLLCPNCHAKTDNYRGKNKGSRGGM